MRKAQFIEQVGCEASWLMQRVTNGEIRVKREPSHRAKAIVHYPPSEVPFAQAAWALCQENVPARVACRIARVKPEIGILLANTLRKHTLATPAATHEEKQGKRR